MTRLTIDFATAAQFNTVTSGAEVFDPSGNLVGYFSPIVSGPAAQEVPREVYQRVMSPYSNDELERIRQEPGESTLAEIWERLRRA